MWVSNFKLTYCKSSNYTLKILVRYILLLVLFALAMACSNKRNTWLSRNSQSLNTRYNVYFNGHESYKEGMDNIFNANTDDYTAPTILLYPISNHQAAASATSQMDRAIEKCEKAIKLHSIKVKPKRDLARMKDPKYQAFLAQEEYNTQMDEVWLLLGKSQFHKADFLAAIGSFSYILNHYKSDKKAMAAAYIWMARTYAELDWIYDAEDMLDKANKNQVPPSLTVEFSATKADVLLKQKKYKEAIPFLQIAASLEQQKKQRSRFEFVLGQLHRMLGNYDKAILYFGKVKRSNPPFEMDFNARVNLAEANRANASDAIKKLKRMLKNSKYKDHKDKIHYTIGSIYQGEKQLDKAIEHYKLAVKESTLNGADKIQALIALADLFYTHSQYLEAQPHYGEASNMMALEHPDYLRVSKRSQMLDELNQKHQVVVLQDSLQALASLSESEQKVKIEGLIKKMQLEEEELKKQIELDIASQSAMLTREMETATAATAANNQGNWYFYNNMLVANGKSDFQRRWGNRKLEDNWRRKNKAMVDNTDMPEASEFNTLDEEQKIAGVDVTQNGGSLVETDAQFYLKQLPTSDAQINSSNEQIASALYDMGVIYKENLEDVPMAIKTFLELESRFPKEKRMPDVYYYLYQMNLKSNDSTQAEQYRIDLINKFPQSTYAKALSQPDYAKRMAQMYLVQDSIYQQTYLAYTKSEYQNVFTNYEEVKVNYPLTPLMPKFMFVNALSEAKTGRKEQFKADLDTLIKQYPQSDVSAMAKDILALMKQGNEVQSGSSHGSMLSKRDSLNGDKLIALDSMQFSSNMREKHLIVIVAPKSLDMNNLQFSVASYNFTGFLVKDFDLEILRYSTQSNLLIISALDDMEEADWYLSGLRADKDVSVCLKAKNCYSFVVSETNLDLIRKGRTIEDYLAFFQSDVLASSQPVHIEEETMLEEPVVLSEQKEIIADKPVVLVDESDSVAINRAVSIPIVDIPEPIISAPNEIETPEATKDSVAVNKSNPESLKVNFVEDPLSPHAYAILVLKGTIHYDELKQAMDNYNSKNYAIANLKLSQIDLDGQLIILVEMFPELYAAKNYLFGLIRNRELFLSLQGAVYRNVIISERNIAELVKTKALNDYLIFNREKNMK